MQEEIIQEGNRLIALSPFGDCKVNDKKSTYQYERHDGSDWYLEGLQYHWNWNWLMPVVEKIESIKDPHHGYFGVHICSNSCTIQATNFRSGNPMGDPPYYFADWTLDTKIQSTYQGIISFIQWYNKQNSKPD